MEIERIGRPRALVGAWIACACLAAAGGERLALVSGGDFERAALDARWTLRGEARRNTPADGDGAFGLGHLVLEGTGAAEAWQVLPASALALPSLQARAFARVPAHALPQELEVSLWAVGPGALTCLASARWSPSDHEAGAWIDLATAPARARPRGALALWLKLEKRGAGCAHVDLVEAGAANSLAGTPPRVALANYVGWYRSPLFPGAPTQPTHPQERWRNWRWTAAPACGPTQQFAHDPDCASSPQCLRPNGRRNLAVGVQAGLDDLPLAGAYDSRDPHVLRYHGQLARAIGLDGFVYLHHGRKLAQQEAAQGREPINEQTFEALLASVEQPGINLKLAVMYEPKVHFNGWISGEPTLAAKKAGIVHDLVHLLATFGARPGFLKRAGEPVVFIFRNDVCDASGTQCMSDPDWRDVLDSVRLATGREPCLIADTVPQGGDAFDGISRWELIALPLLAHRTYAHALAGTLTLPRPTPAMLRAHADSLHAAAAGWVQQAPAQRLLVALAWPGFDDSGVAGWGATNLMGEDQQPLCLRVADTLEGRFFEVTGDAALATDADWLQVATWNDWNERTHIEPRWDASYAAAALQGTPASPATLERVLDRALECQRLMLRFKGLVAGIDLDPASIDRAARAYVRAAHLDPAVTLYD